MQVREVWHILLLLVYISSNLSQHSPHILARHPQESLESRPVIISTQLRSVILVVVSLLSPPPDLDQAGPPGDLIHHRLSQPASQPDCDPSLAWCSQQSRPRPLSLSLSEPRYLEEYNYYHNIIDHVLWAGEAGPHTVTLSCLYFGDEILSEDCEHLSLSKQDSPLSWPQIIRTRRPSLTLRCPALTEPVAGVIINS